VGRAGGKELAVGREMVVDGHALHSGPPGDIADARRGRANALVKLERGVRYALARCGRPLGADSLLVPASLLHLT
jgi:hypothetical protein